ncbi:DUF3494 domain-containing protein [Kaistella daneshvariae]|uniref:DUF3494 domain-containing protein n=1 Tax=Kaistella daneshvariae TaxID=2487074 RepID=A0ABM7C8R1_9FLAO|nr:ice-binding family protein [Kaistella daneshvariae]AZI67382.1 DUF3494 domain-containing protein [Kaistella daneshvariae]
MKKILLLAASFALITFSSELHAQAPTLGEAGTFALFTSNGAVTNTGLSQITGNVGTNNGSSTNFGNVDGVMHDADGTTAAAAAALLIAYNQLNAAIPDKFPAALLGNGQTLTAGTYYIGQKATLDNTLILDGGGNTNSVFIFQINGAFSSSAGAKVLLTNGATACNVFWKVEGLVDLATNTEMKGTIVANNAAIVLNSGTQLEGRALSTTGAVTVAGVTARMPLGCGSKKLTGPAAPPSNSVLCYTIFSGNGAVTNSGISTVVGDIGTDVGLTTGFEATRVQGTIHTNPDNSTRQAALDLKTVYDHLNTLPVDIQLLYPAAFGQNLELTPHTYLLDAATVLNGTVTLNAQGNPDAVFVIKINGALSTSTYAQVVLKNGAQAKNVFWKIEGAINLNDYSNFIGTVIGNNGAVIINNGVVIEGRVLSTSGGISTSAIDAKMTAGCSSLATASVNVVSNMAKLYPNPFSTLLNITLDDLKGGATLTMYNTAGGKVLEYKLTARSTALPINLAAGLYFYQLVRKNGDAQTGKLISKP